MTYDQLPYKYLELVKKEATQSEMDLGQIDCQTFIMYMYLKSVRLGEKKVLNKIFGQSFERVQCSKLGNVKLNNDYVSFFLIVTQKCMVAWENEFFSLIVGNKCYPDVTFVA